MTSEEIEKSLLDLSAQVFMLKTCVLCQATREPDLAEAFSASINGMVGHAQFALLSRMTDPLSASAAWRRATEKMLEDLRVAGKVGRSER